MGYRWTIRIIMKQTLFFVFLFFTSASSLHSQNIVKNNNTLVEFDAAKTNIEPIKAKNKKVKLILNTENGEIACLMNMADFSFRNKLMQEHFNENYMESDKYPKATFIGNIENFKALDFKAPQTVNVSGKFTIHGVTKQKTVSLLISQKNNSYILEGNFKLELKNYKIKIPSVMFYKITKNVNIFIKTELNK